MKSTIVLRLQVPQPWSGHVKRSVGSNGSAIHKLQ